MGKWPSHWKNQGNQGEDWFPAIVNNDKFQIAHLDFKDS